jgi:hypothetical protein
LGQIQHDGPRDIFQTTIGMRRFDFRGNETKVVEAVRLAVKSSLRMTRR